MQYLVCQHYLLQRYIDNNGALQALQADLDEAPEEAACPDAENLPPNPILPARQPKLQQVLGPAARRKALVAAAEVTLP